jgi:hypothetical protein
MTIANNHLDAALPFPPSRATTKTVGEPISSSPLDLDPVALDRLLTEGVPEDMAHLFHLDPTLQNIDPSESVSANRELPRGSPRISPAQFSF